MSADNTDNKNVKQDKSTVLTQPQKEHLQYESGDLFQGKNELIITHAQEQYRLRITRHGKLILTK